MIQTVRTAMISLSLAMPFGALAAPPMNDAALADLWQAGDLEAMERVASTGDLRAQRWMGLMLHNRGRYQEAISWYQKGVEAGDGYSAQKIAFFYKMGIGVEKSLSKEAEWHRIGADLGDPASQYSYAMNLELGNFVKRDVASAARYYSAAAEQKYDYAYLPLARMYEAGDGVQRNLFRAHVLARASELASDSSNSERIESSRELREKIATTLTGAQLQQADDAFLRSYPEVVQGHRDRDRRLAQLVSWPISLLIGALVLRYFWRRSRAKATAARW